MLLNTLPDNVSSQILEPFEKNSQQHLLTNDLEIRTRNMMKCFANTPGALPPPSTTVRSVWNLTPNDKVDTMPMPLQGNVIFLRAPPTTMEATFAVINDPSSIIYETCTPTSHTCNVDDVSSNDIAEGYPPKADEKLSLETNGPEENALPPNDQRPSDAENSCVTQPGESPLFAGGFGKIVDAKMEELRVHGFAFVVKSLLTAGAQSVQSAPLVSMVVQTMLDRLAKESPKQMKRFERALRVGAMDVFHIHWKPDGDWKDICSTSGRHSALTLIGVNKAGLLGSLFSANVVTAEDIAHCLSILLEDIHFDRLIAIHALLLYADDRLCKQRYLPALIRLKEELRVVDPLTDLYLWGPVPHSQALMQDIFDTIEGWMTIQAHKREQCRVFAESQSTQKPPSKVVGPRMRADTMRNKA
ncbi:hypothetical protein DFJ58DRAFT_722135 [Suillus subalutaceus]|uniref:uncharacterized protein n=1 Tax=Suillus subalutaceus TaxID=48586 RepID=UPI001B85EACB|nr:uncharacterized protein DFJ58DRAFT_722135 [Suillus subalutaceus]KAG1872972.1 hypothetical protein DFJ58DRAFT_722135 [Suillus subalutaceus]